jgi:SAM-dependent methyltransferase
MNTEIKQQVREFYNQVGWLEISEGLYQNARYEDLRPVSREYIHHCHLRVARYFPASGKYLLDAGSGPIQYPEYLEYSRGYQRRVCVDISSVALQEARSRIGEHGLFVVADIANLPFKDGAFDGAVSLHTIHHLPQPEHLPAFAGMYRTLSPGGVAVLVNGWDESTFSRLTDPLIAWVRQLRGFRNGHASHSGAAGESEDRKKGGRKGTYVQKHNPAWLKSTVGRQFPLGIYTWRSLNVRFMRTFIHDRLAGRSLLRLVYWLEERFPHFAGEHGAYPLIVIRKAGDPKYRVDFKSDGTLVAGNAGTATAENNDY